jgi:hypothetical protein
MLHTPEAYLTATLCSNPKHPPSKLTALRIYMYTVYRSHIMRAKMREATVCSRERKSVVFPSLLRFSFSKARNKSKII